MAVGFCTTVNAQFFSQNFNSSSVVSDYVNAVPNASQFEGLTQGSAGIYETTITNDALRFNRTANAGLFFYRNFNFATKPKFVQLKMDFEASGNASGMQTPIFSIFIGSVFSSASTGSTSAFASRFGILAQANPGEFKIGTIDNISGAPQSSVFTGKQTITFIVNNSGSDQTYTAPDLSNEAVANGKMDVWVGTTRGINDFSLKNTTTNLSVIDGFKVQATSQSGLGVYDFDNIEMTDLSGNITLSKENFENSKLLLNTFPNPTFGLFEINNLPLQLEKINLSLYGIDSKLIESKIYSVSNGTVKVNISDKSNGVYFIKSDSHKSLSIKVIKR